MFFFIPIYLPGIKSGKNLNQKITSEFFFENLIFLKKKKNISMQYNINSWNFKNPSLRKIHRFNVDESIEKTIIKLQLVENTNSFYDICFINREYLNYCFLYRLTAFKLRAETDSKIQNQTKKIEEFRKKLLNNILFIDQPISQGLILGEKRIKEILQGSLAEEDVLNKIGEDITSASCFWVVLNAALSAWEKKRNSESGQINSEIYTKLKKIKKIFSQSQRHQKMLVLEFKYLETVFSQDDDSFDSFKYETNIVEGLGLLSAQLEKLPSNSYGPLLERILSVYNKILEKNFGLKVKNFSNFKIAFPLSKIETNSRLIEIQKNEYF